MRITDTGWQPITGCSKVDTGCKHCFAEDRFYSDQAYQHRAHYDGADKPCRNRYFEDVLSHKDRLLEPLTWASPRRIYVCPYSDLFHESVTLEFIDQVFSVMAATQRHQYIISTKRPRQMYEWFFRIKRTGAATSPHLSVLNVMMAYMEKYGTADGYDCTAIEWPLPNVAMGVSASNNYLVSLRVPLLLKIPAALHFLEAAPLLGPMNISNWLPRRKLNGMPQPARLLRWVKSSGEYGKGARLISPAWVRRLRDQCLDANIPFYFEWGDWAPANEDDVQLNNDTVVVGGMNDPMALVGAKYSGNSLDGHQYTAMPRFQG